MIQHRVLLTLGALGGTVALGLAEQARANGEPPLRLLVGFAAGGIVD